MNCKNVNVQRSALRTRIAGFFIVLSVSLFALGCGKETAAITALSPPPDTSQLSRVVSNDSMAREFADLTPSSESITWDIGLLNRFTSDGRSLADTAGKVIVEIGDSFSLSPTGLTTGVREISYVFRASAPGKSWLHLWWSPGGSGLEEIAVTVNGGEELHTGVVDASKVPYQTIKSSFEIPYDAGENTISLRHTSGDGLVFNRVSLLSVPPGNELPQTVNPELKYPTLRAYEATIDEDGVLLENEVIRLYAPKFKQREAQVVFEYLTAAYHELHKIVGAHTPYKMVVYHFPDGHEMKLGATSNCTIWYSYENLNLEDQIEWNRYQVPHVVGYIEEMAHNFLPLAKFGWESQGHLLSQRVAARVAPNPHLSKSIRTAEDTFEKTFKEYRALDNTLPASLPYNLADRITCYLFIEAEERYGLGFWTDYFQEVRAVYPELETTRGIPDLTAARNARHQILIKALTRLDEKKRLLHDKIPFKKMLAEYGISITSGVRVLAESGPDWNRKLE